MKILHFENSDDLEFHYEKPKKNSFGDQPKITDILDQNYVYVQKSNAYANIGEGLFAKVDIPKDTVYATYNGFVMNSTDSNDFNLDDKNVCIKTGYQNQECQTMSTYM